ncbi:MAG: NERD domain-containing protein [Actinomycetota bacterium]|nr:NERD domain-containing protein [Actinomycetota bacterium]
MTGETNGLVFTPWTRYGHDRVYVSAPDGRRLGFLNRTTGELVLEDESWRSLVEVALSQNSSEPTKAGALPVGRARKRGVEPEALGVRVASVDHAPVPAPHWQDLASNRPGQAVRVEAEALLAAMKERSKVRTFFARAVDAKTDERAFRVGADGEEAVGPRLEKLVKRGWHVLHSIPVGDRGSDIDHLLIGPGGLYTINTKNHPGKRIWVGEHAVLVEGQKTSYLRNSRFEAERVSKAMLRELGEQLPVRPVLVLLTGTLIPQVTIKKMPSDVLVLDRMDVPGAFKRAPQRLSPETVARVYEVARRSTVWS